MALRKYSFLTIYFYAFAVMFPVPAQIIVTTIAGDGTATSVDGQGTEASINNPQKIVADNEGNLFLVEVEGNRVRKINSTGYVSTVAGGGFGTFVTEPKGFNWPWGLTINSNGILFVADSYNNLIRRISKTGVVTTVAGSVYASGSADGPAWSATFSTPYALEVDNMGNIYVADTYNHIIRKIHASGTVSTIIGVAGIGTAIDGQGTKATLQHPQGIVFDRFGNMYISDSFNHKIRIMNTTGYVSTWFGTGDPGNTDGQFAVGTLLFPRSMAIDPAGNIFLVSDSNTVRRISSGREATTIAGSGTAVSVDGEGLSASFTIPNGITIDKYGRIYVSDKFGHQIRKVTCETLFCSPGTFQIGCSCIPCQSGYYQPDSLQTACIKCPAGTFQPSTDSIRCIPCSIGTYQMQEGQSACDKCPLNSTCTSTNFECQVGYYKLNSSCSLCPRGYSFTGGRPVDGQCLLEKSTNQDGWYFILTAIILVCAFIFFFSIGVLMGMVRIFSKMPPTDVAHPDHSITDSTFSDTLTVQTNCTAESTSDSTMQFPTEITAL